MGILIIQKEHTIYFVVMCVMMLSPGPRPERERESEKVDL